MPSSLPHPIPFIVEKILDWKPLSILEIGPGFGKYGVLCREYCEQWNNRVYNKEDWKCRIDAIEIFEKYRNPIWDFVYNNVIIGDIMDYLNQLSNYDLILIIDVIEHLTIEKGFTLLNSIDSHFIIGTPNRDAPQGAVFGNIYEIHKSRWRPEHFENHLTVQNGQYLIGWR